MHKTELIKLFKLASTFITAKIIITSIGLVDL